MRAPRILKCALIVLVAGAESVLATPAAEIAKKAFASTVLVVIEDAHGQPVLLGSGFVLREHAIVTNMHVIDGASQGYAKQIDNDTKHKLEGILQADNSHDLAVLSVPSLSAPPLPIGDSTKLAVGDTVYAVGNPRGLEGTFSQGIVSSIRNIDSQTFLQITAPISPGSSGGPILNERGDVVGVAVATFEDGQNLNFAIPASLLNARPIFLKNSTSPSQAAAWITAALVFSTSSGGQSRSIASVKSFHGSSVPCTPAWRPNSDSTPCFAMNRFQASNHSWRAELKNFTFRHFSRRSKLPSSLATFGPP
jgi:S1-C subfamily serine protease